ncbi:MAG: HAT repeat-containing protein, partial [Candidatus Fonsibacter sp.]
FEDISCRQRQNISAWAKYAIWEASQQEFRRARSIFERALHVERQNAGIWREYLEMEMESNFAWTKYAIWQASQQESRRARSIFERALRVEHQNTGTWRKYLEMETMTLRMLPSSLRLPSRCSRTWVQGATPQRKTLPCFGPLAAGEA